MSYRKYASAAGGIASEFVVLMGVDGEARVSELLRRLSKRKVDVWLQLREPEIAALVGATPAQRQKRIQPMAADDRLLLLYGAMVHCREAKRLLEAVDDLLPIGLSYRQMTETAGTLAKEIRREEPKPWPDPREDMAW